MPEDQRRGYQKVRSRVMLNGLRRYFNFFEDRRIMKK
jgi:hypothetical protein